MKVKAAIEMIAIKFHLEGLKKEGSEIRGPSTKVKYLEITV